VQGTCEKCLAPERFSTPFIPKSPCGYPENAEALLQRVRAIMPKLEIFQFEINQEGWFNAHLGGAKDIHG